MSQLQLDDMYTGISRPLSPYISGLLSVQEHFCDIFVSGKHIGPLWIAVFILYKN